MAFVNEKIPEADKERFNSFSFKNPVTHEPNKANKWTIDRERDIFLVALGGKGAYVTEIPMFYALVWKNKVINLETYSDGKGNYKSGVEMWWKITRIEIPESLKPYKDQVIELIKEGIDAHGSGYRRDHIVKVNFDRIVPPSFIREVER